MKKTMRVLSLLLTMLLLFSADMLPTARAGYLKDEDYLWYLGKESSENEGETEPNEMVSVKISDSFISNEPTKGMVSLSNKKTGIYAPLRVTNSANNDNAVILLKERELVANPENLRQSLKFDSEQSEPEVNHMLSLEKGKLIHKTAFSVTGSVSDDIKEYYVCTIYESTILLKSTNPTYTATRKTDYDTSTATWKTDFDTDTDTDSDTDTDTGIDHDIAFDPDFGTDTDTDTYPLIINGETSYVAYGTALTAPADPLAPYDKRFGGWLWTVGNNPVDAMPATMPAAEVTATPTWRNLYTVTFWLGNEEYDTFQYAEGDEIVPPGGSYKWDWKSEWGDPWIMPGYNLDIGPKVEQ